MTAPPMPGSLSTLNALRRPRLLVRAACFGLGTYNRNRDLRVRLHLQTLPSPQRALSLLIEEEARCEAGRRAGDTDYNVRQHVELLIALMGEARGLLRHSTSSAETSTHS
ncbi:DUF6477 family protein [Celeribacter neptunius]|uniref:Uncharacterized protein n=1 Tax=Celeribacter neptunius TaxID=588602 RepID=A0A1I3LLA9_9RHOB|nr:DUF6477 family protein [Celeribacter neptunius]SFI85320.1 hypothetical protein SAMN04487991_1068 [Celeribacter neptunius]